MESSDIGEEVLRFIEQYIETVPHLEALLLMRESQPKCWSIEQLAARIYVPPATARTILDDLARHGLVSAQGDCHVFNPQWDEQRQLLARVAGTYNKHLTRVATLIHARGSRSVRDFARAFKLKDK